MRHAGGGTGTHAARASSSSRRPFRRVGPVPGASTWTREAVACSRWHVRVLFNGTHQRLTQSRLGTVATPEQAGPGKKNARWVGLNLLSEIDVAGEYHISAAGVLSYMPSSPPATWKTNPVVSQNSTCINITGVAHVTIKGMRIAHCKGMGIEASTRAARGRAVAPVVLWLARAPHELTRASTLDPCHSCLAPIKPGRSAAPPAGPRGPAAPPVTFFFCRRRFSCSSLRTGCPLSLMCCATQMLPSRPGRQWSSPGATRGCRAWCLTLKWWG